MLPVLYALHFVTHHASRFTHHASRFTHHASRITHHASRFTHHPSRGQHRTQRPQLFLDFLRPGHGLRDLFPQQFTVTPSESIDGGFHGAFGQSQFGRNFRIGGGRLSAPPAR